MTGVLTLMLEQNKYLSHVEIVFISPEEEPNTGDLFDIVKIDENTFVPTIFIVSKQTEHMKKLLDTRRSSNELIAGMLGIKSEHLTPELLRRFIISHELGHAADYVKNYESNPDYQGAEAAEEWNMHYEANLLTMPVRGLDPAELLDEVSKFNNLPTLPWHPPFDEGGVCSK